MIIIDAPCVKRNHARVNSVVMAITSLQIMPHSKFKMVT